MFRCCWKNSWYGIVVAWASLGAALVPSGLISASDEEKTRKVDYFEKKVRPLLVEHCFKCHSSESKNLKGNLKLDSLDDQLKGGDSGPAFVLGKPEESLLIEAVRWQSLEMPPTGKLKEKEIATLVKWVKIGAPWPDAKGSSNLPNPTGENEREKLSTAHWAWDPVDKPMPPRVLNTRWALNPIDQFVLAKLESAGLQPAGQADLHILLRRMYLDLIGLPPTPEQVESFTEATEEDRQTAIERVVNQLLASPHYGERWGRHWLDVARYSDGYGGFLDDAALPQAWRYRDWVVEAFNRDLSYNEFVKLQIAGDVIGDKHDAIATGFFALGPTYKSDGGDPDSVAQAKGETLDDRVDTLGRGLLGLTISCARCHDHKFDPLPQQDYYSLAGVFNNTKIIELPLVPDEVVEVYNNHTRMVKELEKRIRDLSDQAKSEERELTSEEKQELEQRKVELDELKNNAPAKYDFAHTLAESGSEDMRLAVRGNLRNPGDIAPRRFLKVIAGPDPPRFTQGSGRAELAEAVASPNNPLVARVIVNRVWMHHFGRALVRSPSNFGALGRESTHPQLLDWLAGTFIESGWSIKTLHRLIMTSATYQMSSRFNKRAFSLDGDNELLWRMNPRRMDVESWRDSLLAVAVELNRKIGGTPVDDITKSNRRTLYAKVSRNGDRFVSDEFLRRFDFPSMRATVAKRTLSIIPQQFLYLMNSPFMVERAQALSKRLHRDADTNEQRIERAYRLLFARPATEEETRIGMQFLHTESSAGVKLSLWEQYAQVLMCSNEFLFVR